MGKLFDKLFDKLVSVILTVFALVIIVQLLKPYVPYILIAIALYPLAAIALRRLRQW